MAKTQCVLDILKQNDFIQTELYDPDEYSLKIWSLRLKNITDYNTQKEVKTKIVNKMKSDDEYIIGYEWDTDFLFTTKTEMEKLINIFLETGKERKTIYIDKSFVKWIETHYNIISIRANGYRNSHMHEIVNLKVKEERIKREENQDKKVLELLNDIL